MNRTEDTLRAALRQTAEEYPARWMPALDLSPALTQQAGARGPGWRQARWLSASAAAAGVAAVIVAAILVGGALRPAPLTSGVGGLPAWYVVLQQLPARGYVPVQWTPRDDVVVRSTATGQRLATIAAPKGYATFSTLSGSASGKVFLLTALRPTRRLGHIRVGFTAFYLLRISRAGAGIRAVLTALPVPKLPRPVVGHPVLLESALTPDGHKLAVVTQVSTLTSQRTTLQVYDLSTGTRRSWTVPGVAGLDGPLGWADNDKTLSMQPRGNAIMWLIDTEAPGSNLAFTVLHLNVDAAQFGELAFPLLTEDGQHVLESVDGYPAPIRAIYSKSDAGRTYALHVLDIRTGAVAALRADGEPYFLFLWANPNGSAVLVWPTNGPGDELGRAVLWTAHGSEQIRIPPGAYQLAW